MKVVKTVSATEFKQHCLFLLEEVRQTRQSLLVTRHGKPVFMPTSTPRSHPDWRIPTPGDNGRPGTAQTWDIVASPGATTECSAHALLPTAECPTPRTRGWCSGRGSRKQDCAGPVANTGSGSSPEKRSHRP